MCHNRVFILPLEKWENHPATSIPPVAMKCLTAWVAKQPNEYSAHTHGSVKIAAVRKCYMLNALVCTLDTKKKPWPQQTSANHKNAAFTVLWCGCIFIAMHQQCRVKTNYPGLVAVLNWIRKIAVCVCVHMCVLVTIVYFVYVRTNWLKGTLGDFYILFSIQRVCGGSGSVGSSNSSPY